MTKPGFKLRQVAGGQWIKLVDGVVMGLASAADVEDWQAWLASDDEPEPAPASNPLPQSNVEARDQPAVIVGPAAAPAGSDGHEPGFVGWLEVAPWRDAQYKPGDAAEADFLERAIRRFETKFGTAPNTLHVRADHKTLITDGQNRPALSGIPRLQLAVATDPFVLPGTYRLAWVKINERN